MTEKHVNLIEQTFGSLTIKEIVPFYRKNNLKQKDYNAKVFCHVCKGIGELRLKSVLEGNAKSCGCSKYLGRKKGLNNPRCKDLTNQRFGKLTVLKIDESKTKRISWICLCDCGKTTSVETRHLMGGKITSCGCNHHLKGKENPCWKGYEEISGRQWSRVESGAKERNISFNVSIEYAWKMFLEQKGICKLSGKQLKFAYGEKDGNASLDRIDSIKGYEEGNIQWLDKKINLMKLDLPESEFIELCKSVVKQNEIST
jgi:hypothetical protein